MPRICFVTCRRWPEISESDQVAQRALERRGVAVEARPWNVPGADFRGFDAVVLRSNWEYHLDPEGFRAWLDGLERAGARIWNPPDLVRWNLSKRYLHALGRASSSPTRPPPRSASRRLSSAPCDSCIRSARSSDPASRLRLRRLRQGLHLAKPS